MLYVGDAVFDVEAGKAAGVRTAAVTWGAGTRESLQAAQPDYMIDDLRDLLKIAPAGVPRR
jgi:phosphoglycolate phosphatase-like HAD superfamily hydrolase